jgi:AraC family transcriptional regulator
MKKIADQRHRINRSSNFIRENLTQSLDLAQLSDVACFSKFHFLRTFRTLMHETPNQYIARVRLELTARKLVHSSESSITNLALDNGFSGSDTFSRSFANRFQIPPRQFRTLNRSGFYTPKKYADVANNIFQPGTNLPQEVLESLKVNIEQRPEYNVAYIRHIGPYGDINSSITRTFNRLQFWADQRGILRSNSTFLGRNADNCSITPSKYCQYDACIVLEDEIPEDDTVSVHKIPGGEYLVLDIKCSPEYLNRIWSWLTFSWLPQNGRKMLFNASYEYFHEAGHHLVNPIGGVELCLPLQPNRPS